MATEAIETPVVAEEKPESLKSVIAAAVEAAGNVDSKETEKTEEKSEEKAEKKESEVDENKLLEQQGKELLLALRDPEKAGQVIKFLAEQAGYTKADVKAAAGDLKETKEITDDILDTLKGEMGEEFDVLSERIGRALKKILPTVVAKQTEDIRAEAAQREAEKLRGQSEAALTKLTVGFFGEESELPDDVSKEMSKYMDRVQPSPTMTIKELVDDAFHFAVGKLGLTKTDKSKTDKITKNRSDVSSRLTSARAPSEENLRRDNSKPIDRKEAIQLAIEKAQKEGL